MNNQELWALGSRLTRLYRVTDQSLYVEWRGFYQFLASVHAHSGSVDGPWIVRFEHGAPMPYSTREEALQRVQKWLDANQFINAEEP